MQKKDWIVKEVSEFLHTYLKTGYVQFDSFSRKIHHEINKFEQLFILRFLLHEETKKFVDQLPSLIRSFKTVTTMKRQTNIAEVRGSIDWPETIRTRLNKKATDKLTFITNENIRSYDTSENIILKKLLMILYRELYENDYVRRFYEIEWFNDWKERRRNIDRILRNNIYIQRVSEIHVTNRMMYDTTKHRNPLYRNAAHLLIRYNEFMSGEVDQSELEQLLRETFILPKEEDVLFELYWIIQIIKHNTDQSTLYLIDGTKNLVATWETGSYHYSIYHDSTGPEELSFTTFSHELKDSNDLYVQRIYESFQLANEYGKQFFNRSSSHIFRQGRPDIIVAIRHKETQQLEKIIIGEVKYTDRTNYAITGLRELLDYIHLVKYQNTYMYHDIPIEGILCIGNIEWNENNADDQLVQIITPPDRERLQL